MTRGPADPCDVAVVGAGLAGMAAALFAADRGLSCVQVGNGGGILFSSGLLDLLAVHGRRVWRDPFEALAALRRDEPGHPLARVEDATIRRAFDSFLGALADAGLPYATRGDANQTLLTSIGTRKDSYGVPRSMAAGVDALERKLPCLLVDFRGLREYSAVQVATTVGDAWPGLRAVRVEFPGAEATSELYAAHLARALEAGDVRAEAIARVRPHLGEARAVGFPSVLGLGRSAAVHAAFEAGLGVPVFEIPTMPTSVPGLRLQSALEAAAAARGVERRVQVKVAAIGFEAGASEEAPGLATLKLGGGPEGDRMTARSVVLATGRFTGGGLVADRQRVSETVLGLPVHQPEGRSAWHRRDFFDPAGHEVNRSGVVTDGDGRPLGAEGRPAWPRLFAAGTILAHQDWMRSKCGSGLAIATAWVAVENAARRLGGPSAG